MKETIVIQNPKIARHLLKMGETIIDIKPNKYNKRATVFVFKYTKTIDEYLANYQKDSTK